jgi:RNA polymerase sigma factor (sigma-70 family)
VKAGVLGRSAPFGLHQGEDLAAVPSIGRANRIESGGAPEADLTRALYEEYGNQVFRYCLHQLGSREEAEDAVQSTFLNAFRGIKRGVVPELESAWLFKIAHNVCLSRRRSAWRRGRVESPADFDLVEELTPAPPRRADELMGLQDVLEQLPENQRRAILLREWQGLSYREIAAELELTQGAVETLIFRARRSLANGLERPPAEQKRRAARLFDWGNVLAGLKTALIGGSAAAKIAATVAVVSATTVVAAQPIHHYLRRPSPAPARAHAPARAVAHAPVPVAPPSPATVPPAPARVRRVHRHAAAARPVPVASPPAVTVVPPPAASVPAQPAPAPVVPAPSPPVDQQPAQPAPADKGARKDDRQTNAAANGNTNSAGDGHGNGNGNGNDNGQSGGRGNGHGRHDNGGVTPPVTPPVTAPVTPPVQPVDPQIVTPQAPALVPVAAPIFQGGEPQVSGRETG